MRHIVKPLIASVLLFIICMLCPAGCGEPSSTAPFSYTEKDFSLTVEGNMYLKYDHLTPSEKPYSGKTRGEQPLSFKAKVTIKPLASGAVYDPPSLTPPLWQIAITYTAPKALAGLTVSCLYNRQISKFEVGTEVTLTYENAAGRLSVKLPYASAAALCLPATGLLPCEDVTSVSPSTGGLKTVTVAEGSSKAVYTFSRDSIYPLQIEMTSDNKCATLLIHTP